MFERFTKESQAAVQAAFEEAGRAGSPTVEAEHLLLALAGGPGAAGRALREAGLDPELTRAAIDAHFERTLAAVGVDPRAFDLPRPAPVAKPRIAASARLALERSLKVAVERKERNLDSRHLLLALLRAEAGTVPRLLAAEGIEPREIADRLTAEPAA